MEKLEEIMTKLGDFVSNDDKVQKSFWTAIDQSGIKISREYLSDMVGWPIRIAIETIYNKLLPYAKEKEIRKKVEEFYSIFLRTLELQYKM